MIKHGKPPFLECSKDGDARFSAFTATVDGVTIEERYQAAKRFEDGSTGLPWQDAKGRQPVNVRECRALYSELWDRYVEEHPELADELVAASGLSDRYGQRGHACQASELWRIRGRLVKDRERAASVPGPDARACVKCGFHLTCRHKFAEGTWFENGAERHGEPSSDPEDGWIVVVGEPLSEAADAALDVTADETFWFARRLAEKLGVLDRLWYLPAMRCRPDDGHGDFLRMTKPMMSVCWNAWQLPALKRHRLRGMVASGPVAAFVAAGRMDITSLCRVTRRNAALPAPVEVVRGWEWRDVDPEVRNPLYVEDWKRAFRKLTGSSVAEVRSVKWSVATDERAFWDWWRPVLADMRQHAGDWRTAVAWDVETSGLDVWDKDFKVGLFVFSHRCRDEVLLVPHGHPGFRELHGGGDWEAAHARLGTALQRVLESPEVPKIGHNLGYDELATWASRKWYVRGYVGDTMYNQYLLNPDAFGRGLDDLCRYWLPTVPRYWEPLEAWRSANGVSSYLEVPTDILFPYAAWDGKSSVEIFGLQVEELERLRGDVGGRFVINNDKGFARSVELADYARHGRKVHHLLTTHLTRTGCAIDLKAAAVVRDNLLRSIRDLDAKLNADPMLEKFEKEKLGEVAGKNTLQRKMAMMGQRPSINWDSVPQQKAFFIDFLGLPVLGTTEIGNARVDEGVLRAYGLPPHDCGVARLLLKRRELDKFVTSFLDPLLGTGKKQVSVVRGDGLVHSQFKGASVATGRLASSAPNVQAIPRDGDVKRLYVSLPHRGVDKGKGWMLTRDYSGIEVRLLALVSRDETLLHMFRTGGDAHFRTQQHFFKELADPKNKGQRTICKRCLFGNVYGQGDKGLYELLAAEGIINPNTGEPVTLKDCHEFNQMLYDAYPGVLKWVELAHAAGIRDRWTGSPFGFVRRLTSLESHAAYQNARQLVGWQGIQDDRALRTLGAEVSQGLRRAQNAPIQSAAGDLTSMAAWKVQTEYWKAGLQTVVCNVVHDDIWSSCPHADEVPVAMGIKRAVMDNPQDWLPEFLPGYDPSWIDIPILGEGEVGISPKDAFPVTREPCARQGLTELVLKVKVDDQVTEEWEWSSRWRDVRELLELRAGLFLGV